MKNLNDLPKDDKHYLAICNVIKIRNWVKQNIPADIIDELSSNGASGVFHTNGYHYSWRISKVYGITMHVGCSRLVSFNDISRGSGCGEYPIKADDGFYYNYDAPHYGAFIDQWPNIKQTIINTYQRVKARQTFEP